MDLPTTLEGRMERFEATDLYVVITQSFCAGRSSLEVLDGALEAGVGIIQFREKDLPGREAYECAMRFRKRTADADALLIVDDRVDLALAVAADGVHLGRDDLPIDVARGLVPDLIIGASSHNLEEALAAQEAGASYVNIGPIFPTNTKAVATGAVGPEMIEVVASHLVVPFTCMGGITRDNIREVARRGAKHVAVVTAVTAAPDPRSAARELRISLGGLSAWE